MAHFLVTGGAGFIGSHLAEELVRRGHRVRVADASITGKRRNLDHVPGVEFLEGDLADLPFARHGGRRASTTCCIRRRFRRCRGRSPIRSPRTAPTSTATLNVLVAARDAGVRRLVFAAPRRRTATRRRCRSTRTCRPIRCRRTRCRSWWASSTCRCSPGSTVSRPSRSATSTCSARGRIRRPPYSGVISVFATALLEGRAPTIYGDGEQTRDFTYVANVVDGVLRACEAPGASGEIINVAAGGRISLNRLFDTMRTIVGAHVQPVYAEARAG